MLTTTHCQQRLAERAAPYTAAQISVFLARLAGHVTVRDYAVILTKNGSLWFVIIVRGDTASTGYWVHSHRVTPERLRVGQVITLF